MNGIVYLTGAGPGDYRLLTLKGRDVLRLADVVIYDYLADERLLDFTRPDAEKIYVGKKAADHTLSQEKIIDLLLEKARAGKIVVRLKGGDPFVFGRGGEESRALYDAGIPFEIIPGVTSAIGAAAYAGIPVTDRTAASSFAVVTGHEDPTKKESSIRWDKLATAVDTLVFLMGVHNLPLITKELMAHGRSADTPAALVRWGTKPIQETLVSTVGDIAQKAAEQQFKAPAIFVVGDVVSLRPSMQWFDTKPLFGLRIAVTRTHAQAPALTRQLEDLGASCIEVPTIRIERPSDDYAALDTAIDKISDYDWLIFTSTNGVDAFFRRLSKKNLDSRALGRAKLAAIGSATAEALLNHGLTADVVPRAHCAEGLFEALSPHLSGGEKILIPRAKEARSFLPDTLCRHGASVDICEAYQTVGAEENKERLKKLLTDGKIDVVTVTSSSAVRYFLELTKDAGTALDDLTFACIGPITARTCREQGLKHILTASTYTTRGLTDCIKDWRLEKQ
ncbi:MAG: uroporphyrinogen-III C-methyltransferase [Megasphaera massiliensis]|jgi:uroporphyrinogen III methyltransferase/synthase|uniref:uroporphyrinogen-III C-methyltransferase n=1 Tax=Megasphaera massiliensis TaxID=1232428 RepID=UPI002A75F1DB|nr:uroporphyrinogen-III C-methyltransferase [Megasphaera massiliensis]MDY2966332.1 uroporphyrinogen-III C-methyltransferase [Megasphaera massiliensis]